MQFTSLFTMLAVAMTASALPSEAAPRGNNVGSCNSIAQNTCCNGLLDCLITVVGETCKGEAYCCDTSGKTVVSTPRRPTSTSQPDTLHRALSSTST